MKKELRTDQIKHLYQTEDVTFRGLRHGNNREPSMPITGNTSATPVVAAE